MSAAFLTMAEPVIEGNFSDYLWIVVCAGLAAVFMAWGIGANDVANSFATSVGSKTLKLWQAVIVAGIFEFVGCIALGAETTKTIASDISNVTMYTDNPEIYMYGMLCSLTVAGVWLLVATYWLLAVSTTHSIIGAIMGFSLVYGGWNGVLWNKQKGDFPFSTGFLPVVLSWFFSPLIGGILSSVIFSVNRVAILRRKNSTLKAIWSLPILIFITVFINLMFVLAKGAKKEMQDTWPCNKKGGPGMFDLYYEDCSDLNKAACWIAACVGVGLAVGVSAFGIPLLKRRYTRNLETEDAANKAEAAKQAEKDPEVLAVMVAEEAGAVVHNTDLVIPSCPPDSEGFLARMKYYATVPFIAFYVQCKRGLFYNIFENAQMTDEVAAMHNAAEEFDPHTEKVYQALQVLSACCVSFAHGSNDVANAIGPFAAIYATYQTWAIPGSSSVTPLWIFAMGGLGIVFGLLMYGYNIIMMLGVNMLHLTPSRGFSAELGAGLTIALASFFGIPVSTTQIIVGCEVGVGLCEGKSGISWKVLAKTFMGWIWTIILSMGFCAALFSAGAYAPSIIQSSAIRTYRTNLMAMQIETMKALNTTNYQYAKDVVWWNGTVASPMKQNGSRLVGAINSSINGMKKLQTPKKYVSEDQVLWYIAQSQWLFVNYSITAIGQNNKSAVTSGAVPYKPRP